MDRIRGPSLAPGPRRPSSFRRGPRRSTKLCTTSTSSEEPSDVCHSTPHPLILPSLYVSSSFGRPLCLLVRSSRLFAFQSPFVRSSPFSLSLLSVCVSLSSPFLMCLLLLSPLYHSIYTLVLVLYMFKCS